MKTKDEILSKIAGQVRAENEEFVFWGDAILAMDIYANEAKRDIIDKIVNMYVPDGNPKKWLDKIQALK
jgi:hypothetical protein